MADWLCAQWLGDEDAAASFTSVKDEPAASDGPSPAGVGSSDSDSSGVQNDTDVTGATPAAETALAPDAGTTCSAGPARRWRGTRRCTRFISPKRWGEALPLDAWVPGDDIIPVCKAVLEAYRDLGTRGNRQKTRMMWLIDELGMEVFRSEIEKRMPNGVLERRRRRT